MKKVILGVVIVLVAGIGAGVFLLFSNLDSIVKQVIETAGSEAVGTAVRVDSVALDLTGGTATLKGFSVANPAGFSNNSMMSFDELSVALNLGATTGEKVVISSIVAHAPKVHFENKGDSTNFQVVSDHLSSGASEPAPSESEGADILLAIGNIDISDIQAAMQSDLLPKPVEVNLGDIKLQNLEGSPTEIANQIMKPVMTQLANNAAKAMLSLTQDYLKENAQKLSDEALQQADQKREALEDQVKEKLDEKLGEDVREGLGNLLRRN